MCGLCCLSYHMWWHAQVVRIFSAVSRSVPPISLKFTKIVPHAQHGICTHKKKEQRNTKQKSRCVSDVVYGETETVGICLRGAGGGEKRKSELRACPVTEGNPSCRQRIGCSSPAKRELGVSSLVTFFFLLVWRYTNIQQLFLQTTKKNKRLRTKKKIHIRRDHIE